MAPKSVELLLLCMLLGHFFADFCLQTHDQATMKSKSIKWLIYHTGVYSLCWLLMMIGLLGWKAFAFAGITFVIHTITDYCTSRIGRPFWDKNDYHNGFVVIGFDQVLHYIQLYLTFKLLI